MNTTWRPALSRPARWLCRMRGHDWFPPAEQREFTPWVSTCLRCPARHVELPWGSCLGMAPQLHPIAEHYDVHGDVIDHPTCEKGPL